MVKSNWPDDGPIRGDISDFRFVCMEFCHGAVVEYIMHKDQVPRFVEASLKLHHHPGINPANKAKTARIRRITCAPPRARSYWWTTPNLARNDDPQGAAIIRGGPSETLFVDPDHVNQIKPEEDDI